MIDFWATMNMDKLEYGSSAQVRLNIRTNSLYQKEMDPTFIIRIIIMSTVYFL